MSDGTNGCKCGGGSSLSFLILSAAVAVIVGALLADMRTSANTIDTQLAAQKAQLAAMQSQLQGQPGQQIAAAKQHYYSLYADLLELAKTDPDAAAIAQKFGIRMTPPAPAQAAP